MPDVTDEDLVQYFAIREQQRMEQTREAYGRLSRRERELVREAAVMGYLYARTHHPGWTLDKTPFPSDADIITAVVGACLVEPRTYPVIATGRLPRLRKGARRG